MKSFFTADFFKSNRRSLRASLKMSKHDLLLIPAHSKLQKSHDEAYQFVQDSNFLYLTGINEPDCLLAITPSSEILITPAMSEHHQLWEGQSTIQQMTDKSGISEVQAGSQGVKALHQLVADSSKVHIPLPYSSRLLKSYYRMVPNPARMSLLKKIKSYKNVDIQDLRPALSSLRMIKQPAELAALRHAINITLKSIDKVQAALAGLDTEQEVRTLLEYEFLSRGADGPAFHSVVASGANTTQIHYAPNNLTKLDKQLLMLDVGAKVDGYSADITRMLSHTGFTGRQKEILAAVEELQAFALTLLKPGLLLRDYESMLEDRASVMAKSLRFTKHKTIRGKSRVIPHGVSHHLGLDTHDVANYDVPLQPGMVLTVEPGIYNTDEGIGIRLEDDIVITKSGADNLSRKV